MIATFDTLKFADKLVAAGFTTQQAKGQAEALGELVDSHFATKGDLKELEQTLRHEIEVLGHELREEMAVLRGELRHEVEVLRGELRQEMKELEIKMYNNTTSIIKWIAGLFIAQTGVIMAFIKFLL